jgi:hypothetical protein
MPRDADPDTFGNPDAAALGVTMVVRFGNRAPAPNIDVVFHEANGAVLAIAKTDADGVASSMVPGIAMVTALAGDPATDDLEAATILEVAAGDMVTHVLDYGYDPIVPPQQIGTIAPTYPPNAPSGTNGWKLALLDRYVTTASPTGQTVMVTTDSLRAGTTGTVDAIAFALQNGNALAYVSLPGIALAASGTTNVDMSGMSWRTDFATFESVFTNMPAGTPAARPTASIDIFGTMFELQAGGPIDVTPGATVSRQFQYARDLGTTRVHSVFDMFFGTVPSPRSYLRYQKLGPVRSQDTMDASTLLPRFTSLLASETTTVRPRLTYTIEAAPTAADGGYAYFEWEDGQWQFLFPPDVTSMQVPELPDALGTWRPPTDGTVEADVVILYATDIWTGYDGPGGMKTLAGSPRPAHYEEQTIRYPL